MVQFLEKESSLTEPVISLLGLQPAVLAHLYLLVSFLLFVALATYKPRPLDLQARVLSLSVNTSGSTR